MNPDMALPLRIFKASGRPATLELLRVKVRVVRDRRLSWTSVGLLTYLLTQQGSVVDYSSAFASRGPDHSRAAGCRAGRGGTAS